jgi:hypothetical protein
MRRGVGLFVAAVAAFGCTGHGSGGAGFVVGEMHITSGERPQSGKEHDQPLPGVVEVHHPGETRVLTRVTVGGSGRFKIDLPAGNYVLVGRPANRGIDGMTSAMFAIDVGHTAHVDLLEVAI